MSLKNFDLDPDADEDSASEETDDETVAYGETDEWGGNDLEAAYRKALEANDAVEWEFDHLAPSEESPEDDSPEGAPDDSVAGDVAPEADDSEPASQSNTIPVPIPQRITARQVIEAAIFVGGDPLTSKKLCYMLKGDYDLDAVERTIEHLNLQYVDEARPYEIRLGEGGYRMVLREEFERIRNRVFGIGPREVKLSQDVLEVLALVAYRQPITPEEIEELGKEKPGPLLRQLLRRELISLDRDPENRKRVTYSTSKRFLSLFGIGSLDELPQADELAFK